MTVLNICIYTVSLKKDPDIFSCNLNKHCSILITFLHTHCCERRLMMTNLRVLVKGMHGSSWIFPWQRTQQQQWKRWCSNLRNMVAL